MNLLAISLGAGLASALLFAAVVAGSPLAAVLSYAAPLPILIVAMGWHQRAGLAAAAVAATAIAVVLRPTAGLAYAVGSGLPGWWIGYLALLGRPGDAPAGTAATEWYPLGRLLLWIAATAALIALVGAMAIGGLDYGRFRGALAAVIETFLRYEAGSGREGPIPPLAGIEAASVVRIIVHLLPLIAAATFTLLFVLNAWCAARVVAISGRLARPWPYLPATRMPPAAIGLLACGAVATLAPGFLGVAGAALTGALGMASALQGLAFLHAATAVRPGLGGSRGLLLGLVYVLAVPFGGTMLPLLSLVGILDSATLLRRRLALPSRRPD